MLRLDSVEEGGEQQEEAQWEGDREGACCGCGCGGEHQFLGPLGPWTQRGKSEK